MGGRRGTGGVRWRALGMREEEKLSKSLPQKRMWHWIRGEVRGGPCLECNRGEDCRVVWGSDKEMWECFEPEGTIAVQDEKPV